MKRWAEQGADHQVMWEAGTDARMVAKLSRYVDDYHNCLEVVSSYAKSSAVAKWNSRLYMLAAADRLGLSGRSMARLIFVACYIYEAEEGTAAPAKLMVGERYLPGSFLKYNSCNASGGCRSRPGGGGGHGKSNLIGVPLPSMYQVVRIILPAE